MDLASVVAALASVGVRVSDSTPNNNIQEDSSRACPTGLAGPEPSGTHNDPGQHFHTFGPALFWHENTACPGGCGLAGTPLHVPPLGLGGELCSVFRMLAPPAVLPSLTSSCIPPMAHCPSDVCPSPLMVEGPSFCCSPHTWLGRAAVCVICALGHAGWAAHVFHLRLCTRTQRVLCFFFVGSCGLAGTPPHVPLLGLGWMECSAVVPRLHRGVHVDALFVVRVSPSLV